MYVVTSKQMQNIDARASEKYGIKSITLMENAARSIFEEINKNFDPIAEKSFMVFCGKGNNGGDGYGVATLLIEACAKVLVVSAGEADENHNDALVMRSRYLHSGGKIIDAASFLSSKFDFNLSILIDALFGTGTKGTIRKIASDLIEQINACSCPVISIDLPSGVDADNGQILGNAVKADQTISFCLNKPAHFLMPASELCGEVILKDIQIPIQAIEDESPHMILFDKVMLGKTLPKYQKNDHKGSCGKLLIIGGSTTMSGAPIMASMAAMRSGCGIVKLLVPQNIWQTAAAKSLEVMVAPMVNTIEGTFSKDVFENILEMSQQFDAMLIGCGMGVNEDTKEILLGLIKHCKIPMVIDADGLNILSENMSILKEKNCPIILTPHTVEMSRLIGVSPAEIESDRITYALQLAKAYQVTTLLKGPNTITANFDGRIAINSSGNPGMATAGSGDVLAGVIAAFLSRGLQPFEAASAGVYVHGLAGDLAVNQLSQYGLIASDIIDKLPQTLKEFDYVVKT